MSPFLIAKSNTQKKITLKNGTVIQSAILREYDNNIIVDIGSDLIKISKKDIHSTEDILKKQQKSEKDEIADIYTIGRRAVAPVKELVDRVNESVVMVKTPKGLGSGVIISDSGYLLTNYHVVERETQITVTLYKKSSAAFEKTELKKVKIITTINFECLNFEVMLSNKNSIKGNNNVPINMFNRDTVYILKK